MKKWYQSRTIWINILTAIFGVLMTMETEVKQVISLFVEPSAVWVGIGIVNVLLRLDTTSGVEK